MASRARARSRGRARGQETAAPGIQAREPAPKVSEQAEAGLVGRGRQKTAPVAFSEEAALEISAGFHQVKIGDRGGRRRDFHDAEVNTRQTMEHVKASKSGTSGSPIQLSANFFRILSRPQWVLYQYHVDFKPPMESRRLRSALLFQHERTLGNAHCFDGGILFLPQRLPNKVTVLQSMTNNGEKVEITVTLTNELPPTSPVCLQFYNIIFRRILRLLGMQQIGRNYYNAKDPLSIPQHRLTIWPGYTATILQYESAIMLCTDVSHKVLRSETVLDFMANLRQRCGPHSFTDVCAKELVGLIVLTKYNNKTYRIDDIAWDQTPCNTFTRGDTDISFKNYYKNQYGLEIQDSNQVLLISHVKRVTQGQTPPGPALLIPELCYLTGLTDRMRADYTIMKDLSAHTKLVPEQRAGRLLRLSENINKDTEAQRELEKWGLNFDKQLLSLTGRVLPPERIIQESRSYGYNPRTADWTREMRGLPLIYSPPLQNWLLLYTRRNNREAQSLLETLYKVAAPLRISLQKAVMIEYEDHQESLLRTLQHNVKAETQMVVVVLASNRKDKYDSVKKYLCVDCPTPSQCVLARTVSRPQALMTIATKIVLQMSCKMGGELWSVEIPLKQLMVVGIDCYHDSAAGKRSIGALVASLNQNMSRWYSKVKLQNRGQEIMDGLKMAFAGALKDFYKFNKCFPSRIIVYRDGVGDGQLHNVVNYEVAQIIGSIKSMGQDYMPKLSVVVVKKRINCRLFEHSNGKMFNPPPGTVVDTEVTRPEWYDFYIVSTAVNSGSVSPTHYNVVYDTSGLKPDHMQRLTYKLCHMYYNWQGIIAVPAPCQYAHKLAFLVGQSLHREPSMELDDLLFYL
ncbi:piwi-like protein 1 isoform X1 [Phyllopteryx taeniolatus]|uniref:piwi-like protein 1 isoform X1 n=2 Tax=Phyllopteryx taeniolatus TaxID=161469 RepID=UPI002AD373D9|nr:piwi-like protein 1 isoform X1 [Phyllopteryx taeniolatus]XP_061624753.1 piwi-like protein 1 isoform X1 [Phyllopteryx taeniolatus]XP_061624755.1 piwi-like protein 1 isoform X1 [Phyllopteryx taeniolatus]